MGATAAGLTVASYVYSAMARATASGFLTKVAVTQADNYSRGLVKQKVQHLFESIDGIEDVFRTGNRVAIKINLTGGSGNAYNAALKGVPITECMWTHPEVVRAVGELIIDAGVSGKDMYIVEALWDTGSFNNFGYLAVQQSLGAQMVDLNNKAPYADFVDLPVGDRKYYYTSFKVNKILSEVDVCVSIPKMKQHFEAGFTGALKNHVGSTPKSVYELPSNRSRREAIHTQGGLSNTHLPRSICDLNLARPIQLAVIDGVKNARGGEGVWNSTFRLAEDHVLLAGKDPVAADAVSAYLMGLNPEAATLPLPAGGQCDNHMHLLRQKGVGTNLLREIQIVGDGAHLVTSARPGQETALPEGFALYPNFPNPFNPETTIEFHLPVDAEVTIRIYSISGQEIETLIDGRLHHGLHETRWVPSGVASGIYFCEMRAGGYRSWTKLVYAK
jgi:uncharacterized protein (DUF362 family)